MLSYGGMGGGVKVCVIGAGSSYTPELVEGLLLHLDRLPIVSLALHDIDDERLGVIGKPLPQDPGPSSLGGRAGCHHVAGRGGRRGRLRGRPAAGGRSGGPSARRDAAAAVRLHRAGDDRSRRLREGAAHRPGGARHRRAGRAPRRPRMPGSSTSPTPLESSLRRCWTRSSGHRALQRRNRLPAAVRPAPRGRAPSGAARTRRAEPPVLGARRAASTAWTGSPSSSTGRSMSWATRSSYRPSWSPCRRRSLLLPALLLHDPCRARASSCRHPPAPSRSWTSSAGSSRCTGTPALDRKPDLLAAARRRLLQRGGHRADGLPACRHR